MSNINPVIELLEKIYNNNEDHLNSYNLENKNEEYIKIYQAYSVSNLRLKNSLELLQLLKMEDKS